jgi:hypothetical protein
MKRIFTATLGTEKNPLPPGEGWVRACVALNSATARSRCGALFAITDSPAVAINQAIVIAETRGVSYRRQISKL